MSTIASITFHRNYNRPIPLVTVFPFGIRISIIHTSSIGIYPCIHMNWTEWYSPDSATTPAWVGWMPPHPDTPPVAIYLNSLLRGECSLLPCEVGAVETLPIPPPPPLWGYIAIDAEGFDVGRYRYPRGGLVLPAGTAQCNTLWPWPCPPMRGLVVSWALGGATFWGPYTPL